MTQTELQPLPKKIRDYEVVIDFVEDFKWQSCTFNGDSFESWVEEALPSSVDMPTIDYTEAKEKGVTVGEYIYYVRDFPIWYYQTSWMFSLSQHLARGTLQVYRGRTPKEIMFDRAVRIPMLVNSRLEPIMSLTPNEVFTLRGQIRRTKGSVGMGGMGLGWAARKVLQRKQVKHLTVYDKDPDVLHFFGDPLKKEFGDRITLVHESAYKVDWSIHDVSVWDIWDSLGDAAWDSRYLNIRHKLRKDGKVCVGWGEGLRT